MLGGARWCVRYRQDPGIDAVKRALSQIERDSQTKIARLQSEHESRAEHAKASHKAWGKRVQEAIEAGETPPPMPEGVTDPGKFIAPRLYISDGTIEQLGELLQARPQGILRLTDELSAMFTNMSRYNGGQDNEFWLEAWNGHSYKVERVSRTLQIEHLLIGVVGGLQPDKLATAFEGPADGMYARLLFSWPSEPGYRPLNDEALEIDPDILNALSRLNDLAELADGRLVKHWLGLSEGARLEFEQFRQFVHLEREAVDGRDREWLAKSPAHVLRLSGTLCLLDWAMQGGPIPSEVGAGHMGAAIRLVREYFWPHARASLRQIGLTERHIHARRVLRWIRARGKAELSREEVRREALGQKLDAEQTDGVLEALMRASWVREIEIASSGGRPARRWQVNPLLGTTAESAGTAQSHPHPGLSALSALSAVHTELGGGVAEGSSAREISNRPPALGPVGDSLDDLAS